MNADLQKKVDDLRQAAEQQHLHQVVEVIDGLRGEIAVLEELRTSMAAELERQRDSAAIQNAVGTLSYSETLAARNIFQEIPADKARGLLVASKIADRVGITRSVIVNALRKFESAGVIETSSLGMKGTMITFRTPEMLVRTMTALAS